MSVFAFLQPVRAAAPPNVVLVLLDDMGWTGTSVQMDPDVPGSKSDYYETPNIELLAAQGMRFSNAYSAGPNCSPSRAAIFTGRTPAQLNLTDILGATTTSGGHYQTNYAGRPSIPPLPLRLLPETKTIAEHIKQHRPEYTTALFQKDHVGSHPLHYGFDVYDFHMRGYEHDGEDPKDMFTAVNRVSAFLEEQVQAENPFFMMLSSPAIHVPVEYTTESYNKFASKPRGVNHTSPGVAAMTYDFDASLGMILDKMEQLGISDDTYVIFTSDNGGTSAPRNNAPLFGGKGTLWDGGVRVPMIIKGPGIAPGSVSGVPVSGVDMFATIADLLNIDAPLGDKIESASIVPALENGGVLPAGTTLNRAFGPNGELFFHYPHYTSISTPMSAVRDGDYKLVRIYGQNGAPDQVSLYDLRANILESSSVASPLNLAAQMPGKTAELLGKLDAWLAGVDANMDRPVGEPVELVWEASRPGEYPSLWRSTIQVDDLRRESWNVVPNHYLATPPTNATVAARKPIAAYQPGLSSHAFEFDGGDSMYSYFFRVSDPAPNSQWDSDHSASFEMWVRPAALNRNQVLFESGDGTSGLSLSLGDGNADGVHDEIRFRVLSSNGQSLTATADINAFANPTADFVQVAAVVNDDSSDRYIELYVNGSLVSRIAGLNGDAGRLNWDGFDMAGLGNAEGTGVGGNGGAGLRPFVGGYVGQIAKVRFQDSAIDPSQVLANYNSVLHPVDFGVGGVSGGVAAPTFRPGDVSLGASESASALVIQERTQSLAAALSVDISAAGGGTHDAANPMPGGVLPAGADLISYLIHLDPIGSQSGVSQVFAGSVQFEHEILGLLANDESLAATDALLGSIGDYGTTGRGLELQAGDFISITPDQRTLDFRLTVAGDQLSHLRVVTSAPPAGDFDGDGQISGADLIAWRQAFGSSRAGDGDGDGDTDGADFLVWQRGLSGGPGAAAIPEPSAALLALMASAILMGRRRRT